ncbi:MAG: hypothetical protein ABI574_08195 [Burkholderiales bacterium]
MDLLLALHWPLFGAAGFLGVALGCLLETTRAKRRMQAVHHGAWVEQQRFELALTDTRQAHQRELEQQAHGLRLALTHDFERAVREQSQALVLQQDHAHHEELRELQLSLAEARHERWQMQSRTHSALQRAQELVLEQSEGSRVAVAEAASLRRELGGTRARLAAAVDQHAQASALVVELSRSGTEHATARAELATQASRLQGETTQLQAEAAHLREMLDATLVELSAAARARDAREAQRGQVSVQLAIETDARAREARIAGEQRGQLFDRLALAQVDLQDATTRHSQLEVQRDALLEQLTASRRTTRAAVLAAQQREKRLDAELAELRARLGVSATSTEAATQPQALDIAA